MNHNPGSSKRSLGHGVPEAAGVRNELHRRVQRVLEHSDGAVERRLGALEPCHQILERDRCSARGENGVKLEDAIEFVHLQTLPSASPQMAADRRLR